MTFPYKLIDLTHTVDATIPCWDGSCGFNNHISCDYEDCKGDVQFRVMDFTMKAGIGTHMDAPSHCFAGALSIQELSLGQLCMPCVVIDVSEKVNDHYSVTPDDISAFENHHGTIQKNSCVMIQTGWSRFWHEPEKYRNNLIFPDVSREAAHLLLERGAIALGIDTLSPDRPNKEFPVHHAFLGSGKIIIENVVNLDMMPAVGAFVMALPIKVKDATESPVRLVGLLPKRESRDD